MDIDATSRSRKPRMRSGFLSGVDKSAVTVLSTCVIMAAGIFGCSSTNLAGTGTETSTKGSVAGRIVDQNGVSTSRAIIQLVPAAYDPVSGISLPVLPADTTSEDGLYAFANVDSGDYNIQAVQPDTRARGLVKGISVERDSVTAPVTRYEHSARSMSCFPIPSTRRTGMSLSRVRPFTPC
jgi:hypothetical protein